MKWARRGPVFGLKVSALNLPPPPPPQWITPGAVEVNTGANASAEGAEEDEGGDGENAPQKARKGGMS